MIKRIFFFLLLCVSYSVNAQYYSDITQYRAPVVTNGVTAYYYDAASYCAAKFKPPDFACKNTSIASTSVDKLSQNWRYEYCAGTSCSGLQTISAQSYCAPPLSGPGKYNGTTYQCNSTTPPGPDCSDTTSVIKIRQYYTGPSFLPNNFQGCSVQVIEYLSCHTGTSGVSLGKEWCLFNVKRTGAVAPGSAYPSSDAAVPSDSTDGKRKEVAEMPPDAAGACPKGSVQAGVDSRGIPVCIGTGLAPRNPPAVTAPIVSKPPVTVTNADGSTTVTKETVYTNSDGSTTTNKEVTTTAADGTVTKGGSSETTNTPGGAAGTAERPDEDKNNLCKQNPTLSICRNSSVSGTCGDIACVGDAVQCATLRYTAKMQCTQAKNEADIAALPSTALGSSILGGADPMKSQIDAAIQGSTVDMSSPNLDQSGFVAPSCFGNRTLTLLGQPVVFDFVSVCQDIQPLRYVIMACAFIFSYLLVSRSVLNA